jgi:hypothetical protein
MTTLNIGPTPEYIRAALAHCEIPLTYNDNGTVSIPSGPGFDSNGNMTIPEGHVLGEILSATVTLAITTHITDTMVLPSNVKAIREVAGELRGMIGGFVNNPEVPELLSEMVERLEGVASNLDPAKGG